MPFLSVEGGEIDIPRNAALLDTNILVARFDEKDNLHESALETLEEDPRFEWFVTGPVLTEACGLLMSRRKHGSVLQLLLWIQTPGGRVRMLTCAEGPNEHELRLPEHYEVVRNRKIDFVDSYLMHVATLMGRLIRPEVVPIVTSDGRDFFIRLNANYRYGVLNWREFASDVIPIE